MDTFGQILEDARATQREAVRSLMLIQAGGEVTPPMTRDQAITILKGNIIATQKIIERLGGRDRA